MKRIAFAFICVLIMSIFAGCSSKQLESNQLLSVINSSGKIISIGDTKAQVTAITGAKEGDVMDFEDGVVRISYWDSPGIFIDYLNDKVVAIRLSGEGKWSYIDGLKPGITKEESEKYFSREAFPQRETGTGGGVLLAYDEELNPIPFDQNAPHTVRVSYAPQDDKNEALVVDIIAIESRLPS